uniref:Uncharacterized protein n=1 Tax=Anopheles minimus TaxID=112268 RepID=A0A182WL17_9DIPT
MSTFFKLYCVLVCAAFAEAAGNDVQQVSTTTTTTSPPEHSIAELLDRYDGSTLRFDEDTIELFDASAFQFFPNLKTVKISQNLRSLQGNVFEWAKTLTQVLLDDNLLTAVPKKAISVLPSLKTLSFSNNRLEALGDGDEFSGLYRLRVIMFERNFISALHPLTFASLRELKELYFNENRLTSLDGLVLPSEDQLEILDLSFNYLKHVNESVFARLRGLRELSLAGNLFETLRASSFAELHALERLDLGKNFIKTLPPKLFLSNRKLLELHLVDNLIEKLPVDVFGGLKSLVILNLEDNLLTQVPEETFRDQPEFEELMLARNRIASFERGFLKCSDVMLQNNRLPDLRTASFAPNVTLVKRVFLHGNEIATIEQSAFEGLPKMQNIYLDHNRIAELSPMLFHTNLNLEQVTLSHNRLSVLRTNTFSGLPRLHQVDLSHNQLSAIEPAVFHHSPVEYVHLNGNQLKTLSDWVFSGTTVLYLHLDSNELESLDTDGGSLDGLKTLSATSNRIVSWQDFCSENFTHLSTIDMTNNSLTSIEGGCLDHRYPRRNLGADSVSVQVSFNKLSQIPALAGRIELLELNGNNVTDLDDGSVFQSYERIEELQLRNTSLRSLRTESFTHLQHLTRLVVGSSVLEHIDEDVLHGLKLQLLVITNSPLQTLPPLLLKGQAAVSDISLASNQLTHLPSSFFADCQSLFDIDLSHNKLETLDPLWFQSLNSLKWIYLDDNRITQLPPHLLSPHQSFMWLSLSSNALRSIANATFLAHVSIYDLILSDNHLEDIDILHRNDFIHELDVSGNRLKRLLVRPNHRVLKANSNQITSLQWESDSKFRLYNLHLAGNRLEQVDPQIFNVPTLKELDVSENRLNTFPFELVHKLQQLESLIVSRNNIRTLPPMGTANRFKLETLDLSENPLEEQPNNFLASCVIQNLTITVAK